MRHCVIIGISDQREQWFPPHIKDIIDKAKVFSGGKRHHEIMKPYLPPCTEWIDITVPLSAIFCQYSQYDSLVIFASGDPLFYGYAATIQRKCPNCEIKVFPTFNSLQMLAHRLCLPYQDMHTVSLTGRPFDKLDEALIKGESLIGCLTDHHNTPNVIWQRMQTYGYTNYRMMVGEKLGNEQEERVSEFNPNCIYANPNCIILQQTSPRHIPFGLPDNEFELLDGRQNMITKMPIRLCTLADLDLTDKQSFWDVGFCTGSVSIEAKLRFPHLHITAFEIREAGQHLMETNSSRFGTPGINYVIGDFLMQNLKSYPQPDAVFIGGHGGKLIEMMKSIKSVLNPGGCIVFNSVSDESHQLFLEGAEVCGLKATVCHELTVDNHNTINIMKAQ